MRYTLVLTCVIAAASAGSARSGEMPRAVGLYPTSGPALAMLDSKIEVTVRGPIAEAIVTQKFQNRTDHATEATYVFPLPVDAAVSALSIRYGNRVVHGAIATREQAQRRYEDAVRAGTHAALLDQERPDVFTQTVAAIPARGAIEIQLRFDTTARYRDGVWELALPLVVAPRYVPGAATNRPTTGTGRSPDTDRAPDASRITPPGAPGAGGSTEVAIHFFDKPTDVASPTHELRATGMDATFVDPRTDHDAIVRWRSPAGAGGWVEPSADGGYAAVVVEAPAAARRTGPMRCVLVLDRSAASRGDADAIAHPLVRALLGALGPTDRVAVAGSDQLTWAAPADIARTLEQSWSNPAGAFDLTRTLAALRSEGAAIVLVSGGLVADDRAAITAAAKLGVPVHAIGVGPAPARGVLTQIAAASGGTVRFAIPGDDLGGLAKAALADAASQPAPLTVTWGTLAASDVVPGTLPRLGAGQATLVLARVKRAQAANARARGELFAIEALPPARTVDGATTPMGPLARRWARNRLDELLAARTSAAVVTAHAIRYGLVSPYTSMIAVGEEVVAPGGVRRSVAIPVSVPAGMKWQQVKKETTVDTNGQQAGDLDHDKLKDTIAKEDPKPVQPRGKPTPPKPEPRRPEVDAKAPPHKEPPHNAPPAEPPADKTRDHEPRHRPAGRTPTTPRPGVTPPPPPPPTAPQPQPTTGTTLSGGEAGADSEKPPAKKKSDKRAEDFDGEDDEATEGDMPRTKQGKTLAMRDPSPAPMSPSAGAESIEITGTGYGRKRWRLATSLGLGGLRLAGETTSVFSFGTRLERALGGRVLGGADASIWLVDGEHAAGNLHLGFAVGLVRRLELGLGFGLHFASDVVAPAATTSLRYHVTRRAAGFLRFDGALVDDKLEDKRRGQSTFSGGLELDF